MVEYPAGAHWAPRSFTMVYCAEFDFGVHSDNQPSWSWFMAVGVLTEHTGERASPRQSKYTFGHLRGGFLVLLNPRGPFGADVGPTSRW